MTITGRLGGGRETGKPGHRALSLLGDITTSRPHAPVRQVRVLQPLTVICPPGMLLAISCDVDLRSSRSRVANSVWPPARRSV